MPNCLRSCALAGEYVRALVGEVPFLTGMGHLPFVAGQVRSAEDRWVPGGARRNRHRWHGSDSAGEEAGEKTDPPRVTGAAERASRRAATTPCAWSSPTS